MKLFSDKVETDRHKQLWIVYVTSLTAFILLFYAFFCWALNSNGEDWHKGALLILPAVSILICLMQILKIPKTSEQAADEKIAPVVTLSEQTVKALKALFPKD